MATIYQEEHSTQKPPGGTPPPRRMLHPGYTDLEKVITQGGILTDDEKIKLLALFGENCTKASRDMIRRKLDTPLSLWRIGSLFHRIALHDDGDVSLFAAQSYPEELIEARKQLLDRGR